MPYSVIHSNGDIVNYDIEELIAAAAVSSIRPEWKCAKTGHDEWQTVASGSRAD